MEIPKEERYLVVEDKGGRGIWLHLPIDQIGRIDSKGEERFYYPKDIKSGEFSDEPMRLIYEGKDEAKSREEYADRIQDPLSKGQK